MSEAFLRLATEIRAGRLPDDPSAWLYRVGANLVDEPGPTGDGRCAGDARPRAA